MEVRLINFDWRKGYFDEILAKIPQAKSAKFSSTDTSLRYVRWDAAGSNGTPGVNNKFIAPVSGSLLTVLVRSTAAANVTSIGFHKASNGVPNLNTTAVETKSVDMASANTSYQVVFDRPTFSAGEILGLSFDPTRNLSDFAVR